MEELVFYLLTFILVYLLYLFFVILKSKKRAQFENSMEIRFLKTKYKLDVEKIGVNKLTQIGAVSNAFIVANTVTIISFIDNIVIKMLVGFVVLLPMILVVYHLIGKYYQSKQGKK